jgi:predicted kinase
MTETSTEFRALRELVCPPDQRSPDFEELEARYPWVQDMADCPQAPARHGEGDVWAHTRLVMEAMREAEAWQELPRGQQQTMLMAALFHDVGKPDLFFMERGAARAMGHSRRGEIVSRKILWEMGAPLEVRETVAQLTRFHQRPFRLYASQRPDRVLREMSWCVRLDLLWLLALTDARGRISENEDDAVAALDLFRGAAEEAGCFDRPYPFASAQSRMEWLRSPHRNPLYAAHDDTRCEMVVLCGLPGSGKSHWAWYQLPDTPVEGYEKIRRRLNLPHGTNQGRVLQEGRERMRVRLRAGESFVFDSSALTRDLRSQLVGLAMDYGARVRVVHVETTPEVRAQWNLDREEAVPVEVFLRMLDRWEFPTALEGHRVEAVVHRNPDGVRPLMLPVPPWGWDGG